MSAISEKSALASTGETALSAADTLLFLHDATLHRGRGAWIFAPDLGQRGAGGLVLVQRRQRLPEPQQSIRCLRRVLVLRRDREEGLRSVAIALLLKQAFAEPVLRVGHLRIVWIPLQEAAERLNGKRIVLVQHVAVGEFVMVLGRGRGRQRRKPRAGRIRIG